MNIGVPCSPVLLFVNALLILFLKPIFKSIYVNNLSSLSSFSELARDKFLKTPDQTDTTGSHYKVSSSFAQEEETS